MMGLTNQTAATTGLLAPVRILGHLKVMSIAPFLDNPDQPNI